jgi:hypothetical protein
VRARATASQLAALLDPSRAGSDAVVDPVADPGLGWPAVLGLADDHGLLPALWAALVRDGVRPLPSSLRASRPAAPLSVLENAYEANASLVADLRGQGDLVLSALHDAGIPGLPIKGLHGLLAHWWADPAQRLMVDIDVLVPEARVGDAMTVVDDLGYRDLGTEDPERNAEHQRPAMVLPGRLGSLEIHSAPLVLRRAALLPAAEVFAGAATVTCGGRLVPVPSPTHAVVLAIGHAQLQDDGARFLQLPLRALHDVATMVARRVTDDVDWDDVTARFRRVHAGAALAGFAVALEDLFGTDLPVPRRGGASWLAATWWASDHPGPAQRYREAVTLPRALAAPRMQRLYGARTPTARALARAGHLSRGLRRRLFSPGSGGPAS